MKPGILENANAVEWTLTSPLSAPAMMEQLFDHVPETVFFFKDTTGRYAAVNQSLVERCGLKEKSDLVGRHVHEIFPAELAQRFAAQDQRVLRTGRPVVDLLELHWYARRQPGWCLTTKFPLRDHDKKIIGLVGISRDLQAPDDRELIPARLAGTLEYLDTHYDEEISPAMLAEHAGLSLIRFGRLIKRIFRVTPSQLISQTRLSAAARLLRETDQSVAEIAHACGFYDHSAFTRAFRAATGLTPTQFRNQYS